MAEKAILGGFVIKFINNSSQSTHSLIVYAEQIYFDRIHSARHIAFWWVVLTQFRIFKLKQGGCI